MVTVQDPGLSRFDRPGCVLPLKAVLFTGGLTGNG